MRIRTILSTALAAVLIMSVFQGASAQLPDAPEIQAQAAAMTLTSAELPTGFQLTGETFLPLPDASAVAGVTAHYVSVYTNIDTGQQIRSYVYLFESEDQATAGIEVLEGNEPETLTDAEAELGSGNAELSTGTYESAEGSVIGTADATFVRGNAVAGVAVDNPDGSVPESALATDLAALMDTRVQQVQSGEATVNLDQPTAVVPFAAGGTVTQAGYLSANEGEAVYGTQGSALNGLQSSWVQTVTFGEEGAAPRVTIGVTSFASADEATAVVEQANGIFQPLADQEAIDGAEMTGADSVVAYSYTSRDGSSSEQESYRIIFAQGDTVTVVDVQGAENTEVATAAANTISQGQSACQSDGACERPVAPGVIPGE